MTFAQKVIEVGCLTAAFDSLLDCHIRPQREDVEVYCHEVRLLRLFLLSEGVEEDYANLAIAPWGAKAAQLLETSRTGELARVPECRGCGGIPCSCEGPTEAKPRAGYGPCMTCRWWLGELRVPADGEAGQRRCARLVDSSGLTHGSTAIALSDVGEFAHLWTTQKHGCSQWETDLATPRQSGRALETGK